MTNTIGPIGIFQAGTTAEFAAAIEAGQATERDFALLEGGLRAASIQDAALYRALRAGDQKRIVRLLSDRKRSSYLWQAKSRLGHLSLLAEREKLIEAVASALLSQMKPTPSSYGLQSQTASPGEGSECHLDYGYFYQASGHGRAKRNRINSGPVYPTFSLADFVDRSAEEAVAAALAFHRQVAIMRPPGMSRVSFSRRQQEEVSRIQHVHRVMVELLEQSEDAFPLSVKQELVQLMHGEDEKVRTHLNRLLTPLSLPLAQAEMDIVRQEVEKIAQYGLPDLIDLVAEFEAQGDRYQGETQAFMRRLAEGGNTVLIGPATALLGPAGGRFESLSPTNRAHLRDLPAGMQGMSQRIFQVTGAQWQDFSIASSYVEHLTQGTAQINLVRSHLFDLADFTARLKKTLDQLAFPQTVAADVGFIRSFGFESLVEEGLLDMLPHGMVTLERGEVEQIHGYASQLSQLDAAAHSTDHFPIVVIVPQAAMVKGANPFSLAETIEVYVLARDEERLRGRLREAGLEGRARVYPFLPIPMNVMGVVPGLPKAMALKVGVVIAAVTHRALEKVLAGLETETDLEETGFPKSSVAETKNAHSQPNFNINRGIEALAEQLKVQRQHSVSAQDVGVQRTELTLRFLQDRTLPLEVRAAFRNIISRRVGPQVDSFVNAILEKYEVAKEPTQKEAVAHEFLAGHFIHLPWAWKIMIDEGLKRERPLGLRSEAPLGVAEVLPEDRALAWRFAYAATHLVGIPEPQAALILRTAAQLPSGGDAVRRHRRFERLAELALPADEQAFGFLKNYSLQRDPGGTRLGVFLARLTERHHVIDPNLRFRTALARFWRVYLPAIQETEGRLKRVALVLADEDPVHAWDLADAISFLTYHVGENFDEQGVIQIFNNVALAAEGWKHLREGGERSDDDPLMKAMKTLAKPIHFADTLRALGLALNNGELRSALVEFLRRQSGNLHALQYLLVAFYLQRHLGQPQSRLVQLLRAEQQLAELENAHGKIRHDQFLKYALFDTFHFHLNPARFAMDTEMRVAREFASRDDVVTVELIRETWLESVVDFRIHFKNGSSFLVEVKTLRYDGGDIEVFVPRLRDQVGKAGWQLMAQRRSTTWDTGNKEQIILFIQVPPGHHLSEEEMATLHRAARHVIADRGFSFVGRVRIEQRED